MLQITKRLNTGEDLKEELEVLAREHEVQAGVLLSVVGGLERVVVRAAGGEKMLSQDSLVEIVSGTGTVSVNGCHIHIAVADAEGKMMGGHLQKGCIVAKTVELVVLAFEGVSYKRAPDENTGYDELEVE